MVIVFSNFSLLAIPDQVIELINSANQKASEGNAEEAIKDLNTAIKLKNDSYEAFAARGIIYASKLYDNQSALKDFEKAIKLKPKNGLLYIYRAKVYLEMNRFSNASDDFIKSYKLKPKNGYSDFADELIIENINDCLSKSNPIAYDLVDKAIILIKAKYYDKSLNYLDSAITLDSNYFLAYAYRGMVNQVFGAIDKSILDYQKSLSLNEFSDVAEFGLGEIYILKEKFDLAIDLYSKLLHQKPKSSIAMRELGLAYYKSNDKEKAIKLWEKSKELGDKKVANYMKKYK